ncbi:hypothetical protein SAMN05443665_101312 [Actinomadura meyerae]|uniref:Dolichyl-phosphate-mannose-protein mannosyltransferase n=1 Tax=Actinomadura meyerae TaxID=240840 RepID=A0A239IPU6_9ACTN|nr:hypothetical protein [Actinomadura meyerae]SNS95577.1 hypothetical protein SAMN05443665_101312 [Actinomadura meyerae]
MTLTDARERAATGGRGRTRGRCGWVAVAVWAAGIAAAFAAGWYLRRAGLETEDALPPLHARARERPLTWELLPAAAFAAAAVAALPALAARLPWRAVPLLAWAGSAAWAVALAAGDGWGALAAPLDAPTEYPAGLAQVRPDPMEWLRTFTDRLGGYTTHVRGHPPLPTLALWALEAAGLGGTGWAAAVIVTGGASASAAVAVTVRCLAGERAARSAVPLLVLAPLALWIATSMDALFMAVAAWGTALLAAAARRDRPPHGAGAVVLAGGGGLLLGSLPYLSYGLLPMFAVPLAVVLLARPRPRLLAALGAGLVAVPAACTLAGFWWPDGVRATLDTYLISRGSAQRSYAYFTAANLAVLGLLTGPAVAHALPAAARALRGAAGLAGGAARARAVPPRAVVAVLAAAALTGVLVLDASGVTRGEVERIWLPFAVWPLAAAALHGPPARRWLAAQAVTALAVQALVASPW